MLLDLWQWSIFLFQRGLTLILAIDAVLEGGLFGEAIV